MSLAAKYLEELGQVLETQGMQAAFQYCAARAGIIYIHPERDDRHPKNCAVLAHMDISFYLALGDGRCAWFFSRPGDAALFERWYHNSAIH